jgi:hypothetical protein
MLFDQIIDIYFENLMKALCGQIAEVLKWLLLTVTTMFQKSKINNCCLREALVCECTRIKVAISSVMPTEQQHKYQKLLKLYKYKKIHTQNAIKEINTHTKHNIFSSLLTTPILCTKLLD